MFRELFASVPRNYESRIIFFFYYYHDWNFIKYFKIQNLNIFNNIFSKIYLFLRGMFLFVCLDY